MDFLEGNPWEVILKPGSRGVGVWVVQLGSLADFNEKKERTLFQ